MFIFTILCDYSITIFFIFLLVDIWIISNILKYQTLGSFFVKIEIELIYVSDVQLYIYILFQVVFYYRLLQDIEYNFPYYRVSACLSHSYTVVCTINP